MKEVLDLGIRDNDGLLVVSSRIVAEGLHKRHDNVKRDLENILSREHSSNLSNLIIPNKYEIIGQNKFGEEYLLTKEGFILYMFNIQGYNDFKLRYINEFNRMESILKNHSLDMSENEIMSKALIIANKNINAMTQRLLEQKPKVEYYDKVLDTENTLTITQIAKSFGMSGVRLNKILHDSGIQYKQSGQWMLYSKYADMGLTKISTVVDSNGESHSHMKWTQKGKKFIYDTLLKLGFIKGDDE